MSFPPKKATVYAVTKLPKDDGFSEFALDLEVGTRIFIEDVIPLDEDDSTDADFLISVTVGDGDQASKYEDIGQELDAEEWSRFCELYGLIGDVKKS